MIRKASVYFVMSLAGALFARHGIAQQPALASKPSTAVPAFVPMPRDIQCSLQGLSFMSVVGANGKLENTNGTIGGLSCWIAAKGEDQKKEIPLASGEVLHDVITTKDFGKLKIAPQNSVSSAGFSLSIRADKIKPLRSFLLSQESAAPDTQETASHPVEPAFVSLPDWVDCEFSGLEYESRVGSSTSMNGTIKGVTCWVEGYGSIPKQDVALSSTSIVDGKLQTSQFGVFMLESSNNLMSAGVGVQIRQDELPAFRQFLFQNYSNGEASLLDASKYGDLTRVRALLDSNADVNAKDASGNTALILASYDDQSDVVRALLSAHADVTPANQFGTTALMLEAQHGNVDLVRGLIAAKADVNAKMTNGANALLLASLNGHADVVRVLLTAGADVNAKANDGGTALLAASQNGHMDVVRSLLAAKADVNAATNEGGTALMMASAKGHTDVARALIAAKANVNAKTNSGVTALMLASQNGYADIVRALLAAKADIDAAMNDGTSALALASKTGHQDVVQLLEGAGAHP